jgi:hypothetical protein
MLKKAMGLLVFLNVFVLAEYCADTALVQTFHAAQVRLHAWQGNDIADLNLNQSLYSHPQYIPLWSEHANSYRMMVEFKSSCDWTRQDGLWQVAQSGQWGHNPTEEFFKIVHETWLTDYFGLQWLWHQADTTNWKDYLIRNSAVMPSVPTGDSLFFWYGYGHRNHIGTGISTTPYYSADSSQVIDTILNHLSLPEVPGQNYQYGIQMIRIVMAPGALSSYTGPPQSSSSSLSSSIVLSSSSQAEPDYCRNDDAPISLELSDAESYIWIGHNPTNPQLISQGTGPLNDIAPANRSFKIMTGLTADCAWQNQSVNFSTWQNNQWVNSSETKLSRFMYDVSGDATKFWLWTAADTNNWQSLSFPSGEVSQASINDSIFHKWHFWVWRIDSMATGISYSNYQVVARDSSGHYQTMLNLLSAETPPPGRTGVAYGVQLIHTRYQPVYPGSSSSSQGPVVLSPLDWPKYQWTWSQGNLQIQLPESLHTTLQVHDLFGRVVQQKSIRSGNFNGPLNLSPGIYYLQIPGYAPVKISVF